MDGIMADLPGQESSETSCAIFLETCFPPTFFTDQSMSYSAEEMFTHLAFAQPQCGDCLIKALVTASGERGLDAVLPRSDQAISPEIRQQRRWERSEPMLPLVDHWQLGNFSVYNVVRPDQDQWTGTTPSSDGSVNLRAWSIKLLSRYAYVMGKLRISA
jgi:3-O-alpha-D-mannopyranosyl-alpha-D-mannopyranose xylosylphosphotransferase